MSAYLVACHRTQKQLTDICPLPGRLLWITRTAHTDMFSDVVVCQQLTRKLYVLPPGRLLEQLILASLPRTAPCPAPAGPACMQVHCIVQVNVKLYSAGSNEKTFS